MIFEPRTENELADSRLLPKGAYDFEIEDAWEKKSAAGNDMFEIRVRVSNGNGVSRTVTDYLLPKGVRAEKMLHCCTACGIIDKYRRGSLSDDDFVGRRGRLRLGIEKKKGFPDRNVIEDYVSAENGSQPGLKPLSAA